jgi:transcriptional regulator with XRE-family HTH domain
MSSPLRPPSLGPSPADFGEAVKFCRDKADLTQRAVGDKSGLDISYISDLEQGKGNPTLINLTRLAHGLGVDCSKILAVAEVIALTQGEDED